MSNAAIRRLVDGRAVGTLVRALRDIEAQHNAMIALARIGEPAVDRIIGVLGDRDRWVRRAAVELLGTIRSTRAVPALADRLENDKDDEVRTRSAKALGAIGEVAAVEPLLRCLHDGEKDQRTATREALLKIRGIDTLVGLAKTCPEDGMRDRAVAILRLIGDSRAAPVFAEALQDSYHGVRSSALEALDDLGPAGVPYLLDALRAVQDDDQQRRILDVVIKHGDSAAVDPLIESLENAGPAARTRIVWALGKFGGTRAADVLIRMLRDDPGVAPELGATRDRRALQPLLDALDRAEPDQLPDIIRALGNLGDPAAVPRLRPFVEREEPAAVRKVALIALSRIDAHGTIELLADALGDADIEIRIAVANRLGEIKDPAAIEPLIRQFRRRNLDGRSAFADALGEIGDPRAVDALIKGLSDYDYHARRSAVGALAAIGDANAVEPLIAAMRREEYFPHEIAEALAKFGGDRVADAIAEELRKTGSCERAQVTARALEVVRPSRYREVSVIVFRSADPPGNERVYAEGVLELRFPSAKLAAYRIVGVRERPSAADAWAMFQRLVVEGRVEYLGRRIDEYEGSGPDGHSIAAIYVSREDPAPTRLTEGDLRKLAAFWRSRAREWWESESSEEAICDGCNTTILRDDGYLHGTYLLCRACCDERLGPEAIEAVSKNPNHFGTLELEKAGIGASNEPSAKVAAATASESISFVAFVSGAEKPREPEEIFEHVMTRKFTGSKPEVRSWHVIDVKRPVDSPERAIEMVRQRVERGDLPDPGEPFDVLHESVGGGEEVYVVFFR